VLPCPSGVEQEREKKNAEKKKWKLKQNIQESEFKEKEIKQMQK
jgi:hypothetical protein